MHVVLARILAAVCGVCLVLVALWLSLFVLIFLPLEGPSALDACAEPCFGPPPDYGAVVEGGAFGAVWAAISAAVGAAGLALVLVAARIPCRRRALMLAPIAAAALVVVGVGAAQAIAAL
jgi:hypothetical protein